MKRWFPCLLVEAVQPDRCVAVQETQRPKVIDHCGRAYYITQERTRGGWAVYRR